MSRLLEPTARERILALAAEGLPTYVIAAEVGYSDRTVQRVRYGDPTPPVRNRSRRDFSLDEIRWIEAMLDDGVSYMEIGRTVGRDSSYICHRWPGRGWPRQEAGKFRRYVQRLEEAIDEIWAQHLTPAR